jgi:enoyl-CoA hydratase
MITVERLGRVGVVWLDRPEARNALSADMWAELPVKMTELDNDDDVRAVVIAGRGPAFTIGIDLTMLASLEPEGAFEVAGRRALFATIKELQLSMSAVADCGKPVIAAVHGYCLGAGVDLIAAADIRYAAAGTVFSIRETRLAMVADVGTLQRLPAVMPAGHLAELAFTGRDFDANHALMVGLVNQIHPDQETTLKASLALAEEIAANSPLAVQGVKAVLRAGAGRSVEQALDYVALWNAAFLQSDDLTEAMGAFFEKRRPDFTGR